MNHHRIALFSLFASISLAACGPHTAADLQGDAATDDSADDALRLHGPNDLELNGTGFVKHAGQRLYARVTDGNTYSNIQDTRVGSDGNFTLKLEHSFDDAKYQVAYFADVNKDQVAEAPPTDHSWLVSFDGNQKLVTLNVVHDPNTMKGVGDLFGQRSLALDGNFSDSSVHHGGQTLYAAAIDTHSKLAIITGHAVVDAKTGLFSVSWARPLLDGHHYIVAYFADVDASKSCNDPDHRWVTPEFRASPKGNVINVVHRLPDSTDMGACSYFTGLMLE